MIVYIDAETQLRLWTTIESLSTEVGGFGYARLNDDGSFIWNDVFLVPQIVSSGEVDFEATDGDMVAIERATQDGVLKDDRHVWVSWHSHNTMAAFWSNTDEARIEGLAKTGIKYLLSFVGNHKHEYKMRLDMFNVEHHGVNMPRIKLEDLVLQSDLASSDLLRSIHDEIATNVRKKEYKPVTQAKPKQLPPAKTKKNDDPGDQLEEAFAIKELMNCGFSKEDAKELLDEYGTDYFIGPDGVCEDEVSGFDKQAWGVTR